MYDQSFTLKTTKQEFRKSDFYKYPKLRNEIIKNKELTDAVKKANEVWEIDKALSETLVSRKKVFRPKNFSDEILLRKINRNLKNIFQPGEISRDSVVANLQELLKEGIEYRVYRLDIKSFYESIDHSLINRHIEKAQLLSQPTKRFISSFLQAHLARGGSGVPRGLAFSATIAEIVMEPFDVAVKQSAHVYYYGRYVDDIIIVTDRKELAFKFIKKIRSLLPIGLSFNANKQKICETPSDVKPHKSGATPSRDIDFEYLGYRFEVTSPQVINKLKTGQHFRDVRLDIAPIKVKKTKTRISKALLSYNSDRNFELLLLRLKFLSSNFSVMDADRDRKRMAGIYYNYHRIDATRSESLRQLDDYLIKIISSGWGKISDSLHANTTLVQRRKIMCISFTHGFVEKVFLHFPPKKIGAIQRCWKYV